MKSPQHVGVFALPAARPSKVLLIVLGLTLAACLTVAPSHAKQRHVKPPDLRILEVTLSPIPYAPATGSLELAVEVELPPDLDGATVLEVSSLIASPSKRSLRFLAERQPVDLSSAGTQAAPGEGKPRMRVTLTWDGTDQSRNRAESGHYKYEIRAKLLAVGENGPRTQSVSWPKRGVIEVR